MPQRHLPATIWLLSLATLSLLAAGSAGAHARSLSYSSWELTAEGARVRVRVPLLELSRLAIPLPLARADTGTSPGDEEVASYLVRHLQLRTPSGPCALVAPPVAGRADEGWLAYRWEMRCADPAAARSIFTDILLAEAPSHLHFARIALATAADGSSTKPIRTVLERVLTDAEPSWEIPRLGDSGPSHSGGRVEAPGSSIAGYLKLGVEHILTGWDHLAFVLALILLARNLGEVARLVTGFTVAHSLTLALAVLGVVHPQAGAVESVIGFSVALLAAENAWLLAGQGPWIPVSGVVGLIGLVVLTFAGAGTLSPLVCVGLALFSACHFGLLRQSPDPALLRVALAFAFGLVHGFGFAGILAELDLPTPRLAPALLGFNVGVELGQLGVVALVWPLLRLARRQHRIHRWVAELGSASICGLGLFWFVSRAFGD